MRDKRPVDELSIPELERILAIRRREERLTRARRLAARQPERADRPALTPDSLPAPQGASVHAVPLTLPDVAESENHDSMPIDPPSDPHFEYDFEALPRPPRSRPLRVIWWNRMLTGVEIAAVCGLVYLLGSVFVSLQAVTQTSADIQAAYQATYQSQLVPPTVTPVIDVAAVVLPGGHVYDSSTKSGQFNLNEVPVQYRTAYQQQLLAATPIVPPTSSPEQALTITIPALNINAPIVEGDTWDDLQRGVGHHIGSANPGEAGNLVLAGHDDIYGSVFKDLPSLKPGDQIKIKTQGNTFTYTVKAHDIVSPTDIYVMDNSRRDIHQLTLITCYPYQIDSERYVVYATLNS